MQNVQNKTKQEKLRARNQRMRERFHYFTTEKHFRTEYALDLLEQEYLPLERQTIWLIISQTGYYKSL